VEQHWQKFPESGPLEPESQSRAQVEGTLRIEGTRRQGERLGLIGGTREEPQSRHVPMHLPVSGGILETLMELETWLALPTNG